MTDVQNFLHAVVAPGARRGLRFDAQQINLRYTHDDHASLAGFDEVIPLPSDTTETSTDQV